MSYSVPRVYIHWFTIVQPYSFFFFNFGHANIISGAGRTRKQINMINVYKSRLLFVPSIILPTTSLPSSSLSSTSCTPRHSTSTIITAAARSRRVCRVCKQTYNPSDDNSIKSCRHHPAMFTGRLLRVNPTDTSDLRYFYDCCGATSRDAPGCTLSLHQPYE